MSVQIDLEKLLQVKNTKFLKPYKNKLVKQIIIQLYIRIGIKM